MAAYALAVQQHDYPDEVRLARQILAAGLARDAAADERLVGEYTFDHSPWESR